MNKRLVALMAVVACLTFIGCGAAPDGDMASVSDETTLADIMTEEEIALLTDEELEMIGNTGLDALRPPMDESLIDDSPEGVEKWPVTDTCLTDADLTETYPESGDFTPFNYGAEIAASALSTNYYDHSPYCIDTFLYKVNQACGAAVMMGDMAAVDRASITQSMCSGARLTVKYFGYNGGTESWQTLQTGSCSGTWQSSNCDWSCTPSSTNYYALPSVPHQYTNVKIGVKAYIILGNGWSLFKRATGTVAGMYVYQCI